MARASLSAARAKRSAQLAGSRRPGRWDGCADGHHPAPQVWRWIMRRPADAEIGFARVLELLIGMLVFDHELSHQNGDPPWQWPTILHRATAIRADVQILPGQSAVTLPIGLRQRRL